jgi:hypothetical protein
MKPTTVIRAEWLAHLKSTAPADRNHAETAVRQLYRAAGFPEPHFILWFDSPCAASWPVALLVAERNRVWQPLLAPSALSRGDMQQVEQTRAELATTLGVSSWNEVVHAVGSPRVGTLLMMPDPSLLFGGAIVDARFGLVEDVAELFSVPGDEDDLARAEKYLRGGNHGALTSALYCSTTGSIVGNSFFSEYSFANMAEDETRVADRSAPPILAAAWALGRCVGMFWPFEHAAIFCDRPTEIHTNGEHVIHREDGPAVTFRDGSRVFAWNGKAVPDRWITETAAVPPSEYKGFDPTFRKFAQAKSGATPKSSRRSKPGSILKVALPQDHGARMEHLRSHASGRLPFLERYQAGEHQQVWTELVSLGPAVREDPHVADALSVAYETMRRVEQNVRSLVQRLDGMGYVFTPDGMSRGPSFLSRLSGLFGSQPKRGGARSSRAHVPAAPDAGKRVADFEKEFGVLPLSLRAFYEVVGEVTFIGTHPTLDGSGSSVAPDPLLVYGLDDGIVEFDDDEGKPSAVTIAPDDLHKANTSGGDPYEMAIPDLRADGELLNERHNLFFVDYLRLAFAYGGFPGYEGLATAPSELRSLSEGLLAF